MLKRLMTFLLCIAIAVSLMPTTFAEGQAVRSANNATVQLLTDVYESGSGSFTLTESSRFYLVSDAEPTGEMIEFVQFLSTQFAADGLPSSQTLPIVYGEEPFAQSGDVILKLDTSVGGGIAESYKITVDSEHIRIAGTDLRGLMYGAFMVMKYMRLNGEAGMAGCTIQDSPDAAERTVMLDCGRKYFTAEWIKNYIRQMAFMGYNTFEIHFAEDQGFRLDIWDSNYFTSPNGNDFSWACGGMVGSWVNSAYQDYADEHKYLTAKEMVEIIEVAKQYQIDVIPSFDTPMHCQYLRRIWSAHVGGTVASELDSNYYTVNKNFSFVYNGKKYSSAGITNVSTGKTSSYNSTYDCWDNIMSKNDSGNRSGTKTIDVTNAVGRNLMLALTEDFAAFFKQYGCDEFNICADEVAFYRYDGWAGYASSYVSGGSTKYDTLIDYVNEVTELLYDYDFHVRAFCDFIDRDGEYDTDFTTSSYANSTWFQRNIEFDPDLEIVYWELPYTNSGVQPVDTFIDKGSKIYNAVENYNYYVLALYQSKYDDRGGYRFNWAHISAENVFNLWNPTVFSFPNKTECVVNAADVDGGYFLIWSDYGAMSTESEIWNGIDSSGTYNVIERMWSNVSKMWNYDLNSAMTFSNFASMTKAMGYYPGYTDCTKALTLPTAQSVQPAHNYESEITTEPTCTQDGVRTYTCTNCGDVRTEAIPALGHSYEGASCARCGSDRDYVLMHFQNGSPELEYTWEMVHGTYHGNGIVNGDTFGAFKGYILNATDPYLRMTDGNINYDLRSGDVVQIRVQLSNEADSVLTEQTGLTEGTLLFDQNFKAYLQTSANEYFNETYTGKVDVIEGLQDGEYGIATLQISNAAIGTTLQRIRIDFMDSWKEAASGIFRLDYIYIGPPESAPVKVDILDEDGNELYSQYHGYKTSMTQMPQAPEKASDEEMHYVFNGWKNEQGAIVDVETYSLLNDTVFTASYEAKTHSFTYTDNEDGSRSFVCQDCQYEKVCTHTWNEGEVVIQPGCVAQGEKIYTCQCGASYSEAIEATGHSYEKLVTDPTCTENGFTTNTCTVCGDTYTDAEVDALGHTYESVVTAPTCTDSGFTTNTCTVCGDTYTDAEVDALGHTYESVVTAPTCTEIGFTTYTCATCAASYTDDLIEANGHSYDEGVVTLEPTCVSEGVMTFTCHCGDSYTQAIAAEGHSMILKPYVAATCVDAGYSEHYECSLCQLTFIDEAGEYPLPLKYFAISARGHNYKASVTAPTCTEGGYTAYACAACGDSYTADETAALGHSYAYANNGENHTVTCGNCDYNASEDHNYVDGTCICGAVEVTEPKYEPKESLKFTMSISVGAEMTVTYNIMGADVNSYSDFYLEVKKDVAGGEPVTTVYGITANREQMTAKVNPATGEALMYQVTYKGINAKEMGDNFSTTLYAVGEDGTIYYGTTVVDSIKSFLVGKIDAETSIPELKTMAVDMLKYGAAAQVRLGYNTDNLVTADLTEDQLAYATKEIPEAVNNAASTGEGASVNTNITVTSRVQLNLSCVYTTATDPNAVKCVITDSEGKVLAEIAATNKGNIMFSAIYENVGAKEMRDVINATFYEGETAISKTISWSAESYVAQVRAKTNVTEDELNMVNAMLTYGDSVAAYMKANAQ
ncbi:MAG: hypothetical protein E7434_03625 [Ruminococcaceae bacterium]|nr:hypothetical protein [Oscillospiraceae bacterium]